jgi:hypothetical protein
MSVRQRIPCCAVVNDGVVTSVWRLAYNKLYETHYFLMEIHMPWFRTALVGSMSLILPAVVASANPFDAMQVPVDSKWLLHVDFDAARGSKTWDLINGKLGQNPEYGQKVEEVAQITGMHFPEDFHDVTVFGKSAAEDSGVVLIHGKIDKDKTMSALESNPSYASEMYGTYQVSNWDDKGVKNFGAFHGNDLVVLGRSAAIVENALDTLDAKSASLKSDSPLAGGTQSKALVYVAAKDVASLKKGNQAQSPLVLPIDSAAISFCEQENNLVIQGNVVAITSEAAVQMQQTVNGLRALMSLKSNADDADANTKSAAAALATLSVTQQDHTLNVQWPVSLDLLKGFLEKK